MRDAVARRWMRLRLLTFPSGLEYAVLLLLLWSLGRLRHITILCAFCFLGLLLRLLLFAIRLVEPIVFAESSDLRTRGRSTVRLRSLLS